MHHDDEPNSTASTILAALAGRPCSSLAVEVAVLRLARTALTEHLRIIAAGGEHTVPIDHVLAYIDRDAQRIAHALDARPSS